MHGGDEAVFAARLGVIFAGQAGDRGTGGGAKTIEPDTDDLDAFAEEFFRKKR